jgi:radical SAM superfamily enzyme YgiQ (UPF0313 family)
MRIAVIRPSMFGVPASDALMPLFFAIARSLIPPEIPVDFYDERVRRLPGDIPADVILLTVETFAAARAYEIADSLRGRGRTVVMGGFHPTMCPVECLEHADCVALGDAEDTLPQILHDIECGALKKRYVSGGNCDLSGLRYDYSVFRRPRYRLMGLAQFGRGCKFACDFCSVHAFYPGAARFRPLDAVLAEIRAMPQKFIFFVDDNLFSDRGRLEALLDSLRPLHRLWVCQISMDVARDPALLEKMRASGCRMVIIGFESLDRSNLETMHKSANLAQDGYLTAIRNLHGAGLMIYGTFIIGYDADTAATAGKLMRFAQENHFAIANFNPLMPMPGTALYERLGSENRLAFADWWVNGNYRYGDAQIVPAGMSGGEMTESCRRARYGFYSAGSVMRRLRGANIKGAGNLLLYLAANIVSGREIRFKQGRKLGKPQ